VSDVQRGDEPAVQPPKEDPESLVLRGRPRPVVRFRRGLVIGATGAVCAALIAVTWMALEPPSFRLGADQESAERTGKATPDVLANAPANYGDVPRLGPPLPGDLGRPILEHQRSLEAGGQTYGPDPRIAAIERARAAAEAERQRIAEAREAARASGVIVQLSGRREQEPHPEGQLSPAPPPTEVPTAVAAPAGGGQQRKIDFARSSAGDLNPDQLIGAPSRWTLSAGTIIPASLITGLNSDLPGTVLAQVTEHVRDSATGRTVLIPQGSRLIGSYDSVVAYGQRRALLAWQRIVLPDGSSIQLDNMPATDLAGYAGVEDRVDFHTWRLLKGIALSTLLGVGTELSLGSGESDLVRAIRESTQTNAARAGDQITQRNLDVQPTLKVRPGWPLRAVIHKDLVLKPWRG
jgi:type IV secretory pathway VirB10-like protein